MLIGRIPGRIIVAYESKSQAIIKKSCIACIRYKDNLPCKMYAHCRANNIANEEPMMFALTSSKTIENRMTPIRRIDLDGLKRCCI